MYYYIWCIIKIWSNSYTLCVAVAIHLVFFAIFVSALRTTELKTSLYVLVCHTLKVFFFCFFLIGLISESHITQFSHKRRCPHVIFTDRIILNITENVFNGDVTQSQCLLCNYSMLDHSTGAPTARTSSWTIPLIISADILLWFFRFFCFVLFPV